MTDEEFDRHLVKLRTELRNYTSRMLRSQDDGEDAAQDASIKAWRSRERFTRENFRPWMFVCAKRAALNFRAKEWPRRELMSTPNEWSDEASEYYLDPTPPPEEAALSQVVDTSLLDAVNRLPPAMKAAVQKVYIEGLEITDAAEALGVSYQSVNLNVWKARMRLRKEVQWAI
jgi:RNA polymerase sigma-70 factor (ECF subfamily)